MVKPGPKKKSEDVVAVLHPAESDLSPGHPPAADEHILQRTFLPQIIRGEQFGGERFVTSLRGEIALEHIHRYVAAANFAAGKEVLDIACGEGYGCFMIGQHAKRVVGVDISDQTVKIAQERYASDQISFVTGRCESIPCGDAAFDLVVSLETIEHIENQTAFLKEVKRVLRKGGMFLVSTPDRLSYNALRNEPNPFHLHELSREELTGLLKASFANVAISEQKCVVASAIVPERGALQPGVLFANLDSHRQIVVRDDPRNAPYLMVLCSDSPLPPLYPSLYEGDYAPGFIGEAERHIALYYELKEREAELEKNISNLTDARDAAARYSRHLEEELQKTRAQTVEIQSSMMDELHGERAIHEEQRRISETKLEDSRSRIFQIEHERKLLDEDINQLRTELSAARSREVAPEANRRHSSLKRSLSHDLQALTSGVRGLALTGSRVAGMVLSGGLKQGRKELEKLELIQQSGLFEPEYFRHQYPHLLKRRTDLLQFFLRNGNRLGLNPGPLFDSAFYVRQLEVSVRDHAAGENYLLHYLTAGAAGGLDPHPLFDSSYYLEMNADVREAGLNPLSHFISYGWKEGRRPHPLLDIRSYLRAHRELYYRNQDPLHDIVSRAEFRVIPGCDWFDEAFYLSAVPEAALEPRGAWYHLLENFWGGRDLRPSDEEIRQTHSAFVEYLDEAQIEPAPPLVSIIIPVHNKLRYTLGCLQSILRSAPATSFEVIIVDDASNDGTHEVCSSLPGVVCLRSEANGGFIQSCNRGAAAAKGRFLVFLNNDTRVLPGWLDELIETFERFPNAGLVGSQLIYPTGLLQEAGGIIWQDGSGWNYGRNDDRLRPEYNYLREVDYCSGASLMIECDLFFKLKQFDDLYSPAYCEDVDLAFKVRSSGRSVLYQPASKLVHFEGVSSGTDLTKGVKSYQVENMRKFYERWKSELETHRPGGKHPELERDRGASRRALFIDACTPTPDRDAGSIIADFWLTILQQLGFKVSFIPQSNMAFIPGYSESLQKRGIECVYAPSSPSTRSYLQQIGDNLDLVVIFRFEVGEAVIPSIRELCPSAKIIFHTVDLHYLRLLREAELLGSDERRAESEIVRPRELAVCNASDVVCTPSTFERAEIEREGKIPRVEVSSLILAVPGRKAGFEERADFCFVGGFGHRPNVDGVLYFVNEVMPHVRKLIPGVNFLIVGSGAPKAVTKLKCEDVKFLGFVEDLSGLLESVRLSIAPLRYGAGVKGKVGVSMSYGVPVVGTPLAFEGMELNLGEEVLMADNPEAMAQAIASVYTDRERWEKISEAGIRRAQADYSIEANRASLARIIQGLGIPLDRSTSN